MALVVVGAAGCGGNGATADKTVTVTTPAPPPVAASPSTSDEPSGGSGASERVGPPLPAGVAGVDGRYLLKAAQSDYDGQDIGERFFSYEEPSDAATTCAGGRCTVRLRLGLRSGGSKAYTLIADPARKGTYIGTSNGQVMCVDDRTVPSHERIALRAGSVKDIGGRQVAGRLGVYFTTTAVCKEGPAKSVVTLRGPRQP